MDVDIDSPKYVRLLGHQFEPGERHSLPVHLVRVLCKAGVGRDPSGKILTDNRRLQAGNQIPIILDDLHVYVVSVGIWVTSIVDDIIAFSIREELERQRRPGRSSTFSDDELALIKGRWNSENRNRGSLIRALELGDIRGIDSKKAFSPSTVDRLIRTFKIED